MTRQTYTGLGGIGDTMGDLSQMQFVVRQLLNRMATATLVLVKAVGDGTVDAQPMVAQLDGAGNAIPHGTIYKMPVHSLRAGASAVVIPPKVGDIGLAVFCHNDISSVKRARAPANPNSRRRFDWADGIYLGGLLGDAPTQFIRIDDDGIAIQSTSGKPVTITSDTLVDLHGPVNTDTEYRVDGTKVVSNQQSALPANATDLASAIALVNAMKAGLRAHGLFA